MLSGRYWRWVEQRFDQLDAGDIDGLHAAVERLHPPAPTDSAVDAALTPTPASKPGVCFTPITAGRCAPTPKHSGPSEHSSSSHRLLNNPPWWNPAGRTGPELSQQLGSRGGGPRPEAARPDGWLACSVFWRICRPRATPLLVIDTLSAFRTAWIDFVWPLIVAKGPSRYTLQE